MKSRDLLQKWIDRRIALAGNEGEGEGDVRGPALNRKGTTTTTADGILFEIIILIFSVRCSDGFGGQLLYVFLLFFFCLLSRLFRIQPSFLQLLLLLLFLFLPPRRRRRRRLLSTDSVPGTTTLSPSQQRPRLQIFPLLPPHPLQQRRPSLLPPHNHRSRQPPQNAPFAPPSVYPTDFKDSLSANSQVATAISPSLRRARLLADEDGSMSLLLLPRTSSVCVLYFPSSPLFSNLSFHFMSLSFPRPGPIHLLLASSPALSVHLPTHALPSCHPLSLTTR